MKITNKNFIKRFKKEKEDTMEGKPADTINVSWNVDSAFTMEDRTNSIAGDWSFRFTLDAIENETRLVDLETEEKGLC